MGFFFSKLIIAVNLFSWPHCCLRRGEVRRTGGIIIGTAVRTALVFDLRTRDSLGTPPMAVYETCQGEQKFTLELFFIRPVYF